MTKQKYDRKELRARFLEPLIAARKQFESERVDIDDGTDHFVLDNIDGGIYNARSACGDLLEVLNKPGLRARYDARVKRRKAPDLDVFKGELESFLKSAESVFNTVKDEIERRRDRFYSLNDAITYLDAAIDYACFPRVFRTLKRRDIEDYFRAAEDGRAELYRSDGRYSDLFAKDGEVMKVLKDVKPMDIVDLEVAARINLNHIRLIKQLWEAYPGLPLRELYDQVMRLEELDRKPRRKGAAK